MLPRVLNAPHAVSRSLLPRPEAAAQARHTVAALDLPQKIRDTLTLIVSELVTNSVRHAGLAPTEAVDLEVTADTTRVRVEVRDRGPGFVRSRLNARPGRLESGGQGLVIVSALAAAWGAERDPGGCTVWCEVVPETAEEALSESPQRRYDLWRTPTLSTRTAGQPA